MDRGSEIVALIPRLRRYARALIRDQEQADDLVQDTLERAWTKMHLFRIGSDLRAWLFTVMHNVHVNKVRSLRPTDPLGDEYGELPDAASADPLMLRDLDRALALLPLEQREALLLVALEDMSYDETAKTLGIPIGTVMSRLSRAREKLRVHLFGIPVTARLKRVK